MTEGQEIRRKLKAYLRRDDPVQPRFPDGQPICPVSGKVASHMHEIISWPGRGFGDKYGHRFHDEFNWNRLARVYFVKELCILLDGEVNIDWANHQRDHFLTLQCAKYGVDAILKAIMNLGRECSNPHLFVPHHLEFEGVVYPIVFTPTTMEEETP